MRTHTETEILDAVIVGGGAAGLSAALVLGRARRSVAVIDSGKPRNAPAAHMHGFLSRDGMAPRELLAVGRSELQTYGVELTQDDVVDISWRGIEAGFVVELSGGTTLETRTVLVATGLRDSLPEIQGIQELWGQSVLHCPLLPCVRDQRPTDRRSRRRRSRDVTSPGVSTPTVVVGCDVIPRQDLAHPRRTRATGCPRSDGCRRIGIWIDR